MIRAVLVGRADCDWRLYRQAQWMAEVRRSPEVTTLPRKHFDIPDDLFTPALDGWGREGAGASLSAATQHLGRHGAVEVSHP